MKIFKAALALGLFFVALSLPAFAGQAGPRLALGAGKILTGRFVHEHPIEGISNPLRTEGSFTITGADGLIWAIEKPMATTTHLSGGVLTQKVGPYQILQMTPAQMPLLAVAEGQIRAALSGDWAKLNGDYIVSRKGDEKAWVATLTPRVKKGKPFQKIVAHGGLFVENVEITLPKATDKITFSDQKLIEDVNPAR